MVHTSIEGSLDPPSFLCGPVLVLVTPGDLFPSHPLPCPKFILHNPLISSTTNPFLLTFVKSFYLSVREERGERVQQREQKIRAMSKGIIRVGESIKVGREDTPNEGLVLVVEVGERIRDLSVKVLIIRGLCRD